MLASKNKDMKKDKFGDTFEINCKKSISYLFYEGFEAVEGGFIIFSRLIEHF